MKGTEKQVKWAEEIKAGVYQTLAWIENRLENDRFYTDADLRYVSREAVEALRAEYDAVFERVDSAALIIDKRDMFSSKAIINHGRDWMRHHGQFVRG